MTKETEYFFPNNIQTEESKEIINFISEIQISIIIDEHNTISKRTGKFEITSKTTHL